MMMDDFGYFDGYDIDYNGLDTRPAKMLLCRFSIGANPFHRVCPFCFYDICNEQELIPGCATGKVYAIGIN
jgi:hypothetical protein